MNYEIQATEPRTKVLTISAFLRAGYKPAQITRELGVAASTIPREIKRNIKDASKVYSAAFSQELSDERKERVRRNRRISDYLRKQALNIFRDKQ